MNLKKTSGYTKEQKEFHREIIDNGFCLTSDVFEEPAHIEIATYEYKNEIYYFRIADGKVVSFKELS